MTFTGKEHLAEGVTLISGDCLAALPMLDADSFDACVTDPPYGLSFMGKAWDHGVPGVEYWEAIYRVLKPGAHLLAFGGDRTQHRLACAIEDAGFEIRGTIAWIFGQGFPKNLNCLKPAMEMIVLARKPLSEKNVAANILKWGTGALNIDGCRVEHVTIANGNLALNPHLRESINGGNGGKIFPAEADRRVVTPNQSGRWPANVIHDGSDEVAAAFPAARSGEYPANRAGVGYHGGAGGTIGERQVIDEGGFAARFFYAAKADTGRWPANVIHDGSDEVVAAFPETSSGGGPAVGTARSKVNTYGEPTVSMSEPYGSNDGSASRFFYTAKADSDDRLGSKHPTVKPLDLMQYLVRLITPPRGLILDPFAGTGTMGEAAFREGFRAALIEREEEYQNDIRRRMKLLLAGSDERARATIKEKTKDKPIDAGPLFGWAQETGGKP